MNNKTYKSLIAGVAIASLLALPLYADEHETTETETRPLSGGESKVINKITTEFTDLAGEDTGPLVEALRTGDELSYVVEVEQVVLDDLGNPVLIDVVNDDGSISQIEQTELVEETVVVENTAGPMGFGNVKLVLGLAAATLPEDAAYRDLVEALYNSEEMNGILDMRADGMGWGEIYHAYDLKVGHVKNGKDARPERLASVERREKLERPQRPERPERPVKPERPEKPERPVKPERPEKPEKPGRPNRA